MPHHNVASVFSRRIASCSHTALKPLIMNIGSVQSCPTNRGPLTTTFTPPSTCLETTSVFLAGYRAPPTAQTTLYYVGFWTQALPDYVPSPYTSDSCMPSAATPVPLQSSWYHSPGICPASYTPAASLLTLPCDSEISTLTSVTAWVCCPS